MAHAASSRSRAWQWLGRLGTVLLIAIGAVSIALNYTLARAVIRYLDEAEALRLDPAGLDIYARERTVPSGPGPTLVFFGDSRAFMWSPPESPLQYRVFNRGIGYQTTSQVLLRLGPDVLSLHPAVVVLEAGVNDLKAIASFPARRQAIVAECERNIETIVQQCTEAGASVVLVTVFDIGNVEWWRRPLWSDDVENAVREVNAFLRTLVRGKVVLFDANPVLEDSHGRIQQGYSLDYLHLSSAGYAALNSRLLPTLSTLHP